MSYGRIIKRKPSAIDAITDPVELARELLRVTGEVNNEVYSSYCRVSQLATFCPREYVLGFRGQVENRRVVWQNQRFTFDIGNAYHAFIQNTREYFGDRRVGWWECLKCGAKRFGLAVSSCTCGAKSHQIIYREHSMRLEEPFRITGHPDLFLSFGDGDIRVAELKSISATAFERLTAPLADHVYQLHGYIMLLPLDGSLPIQVNQQQGLLIYVSKQAAGPGGFPVKAFHVSRSPVIVKAITTDLLSHKRGIEDAGFFPPPRPACIQSQYSHALARNCSVSHLCRGGVESK
jgi:hypothetical protein